MTRARWLVGLLLSVSMVLPACGGDSASGGPGGGSAGSGGTPIGSGGAVGSGGSAVGGTSSSGAQTGSGGASATGGTSSGSGGAVSSSGWEEVRCFQYQQTTARNCYARLGNLWSLVAPVCGVDGEPHNPMTRNATECGGTDDATGWDETWCDDLQCYGRLGDWLTVLGAPCDLPSETPSGQTPSEVFCAAAPEAPTPWQDVLCYEESATIFLTICFGFLGTYYPTWGLVPDCQLEVIASDPDHTEVTPDATCP